MPAACLKVNMLAAASLAALLTGGLLAGGPAAWAREAASPGACQAAASSRPIVAATAALEENPDDARLSVVLADAWSDAGCFNDAVGVLQRAAAAHPGNQELETRLRVARSLVGEEHFFDNLDRATAEARFKRDSFRCSNLGDLQSCDSALRMKPDDPTLLVEQGDALLRAKRPADALSRYRLAAVLAPEQHDVVAKIAAAESLLPATTGAGGALGWSSADPTPASSTAAPSTAGSSTVTAATAPSSSAASASASSASSKRNTEVGPPLRAAISGGEAGSAHRYSNTEPETESH